MNSTGITRNIDEVGRLVIPREIRKSLKLTQGTPLEIFIDQNGDLVLKKFSTIFDMRIQANNLSKIIHNIFDIEIIISDMEKIVAYSGKNKKEYIEQYLDSKLSKLIENRTKKYFNKTENIKICKNLDKNINNFALVPIIIDSVCCGAIMLINTNDFLYSEKMLIKIGQLINELMSN